MTHLLQNPPCEIIQSNGPNMPNELDVSSAPVLPDPPACKLPVGNRDQFSMQNLPKTVNLPERDLPENLCSVERGSLPVDVNDIQDEQHPVSSDGSESNKEMDEPGSGESEEEITHESNEMEMENEEETERQTGMDTSVRRSDRPPQPPKRLDYIEFGKPWVTAVKSFFHGLTIALADALNEEENSP